MAVARVVDEVQALKTESKYPNSTLIVKGERLADQL
jgi:hypothetical protein